MRLSGTNELLAIGAVILVTCFAPHLVSPLVRSHVGKAVALAAVAWVSLHVSPHLALLLAVLVLSCCSGWEHMDGSGPTCMSSLTGTACTGAGGTLKDGKCNCPKYTYFPATEQCLTSSTITSCSLV